MENEKMIFAGSLVAGRQRGRLVNWVTQHQLVLFFAGTFLFSWLIYALVAAFPIENGTTFSRILLIAAYGPSLSAILLTRITTSKPKANFSLRWLALFVPLLGLVAGIEWLDHRWWGHRIEWSLILADSILVLLAAVTLTWLWLGRTETHSRFVGAAQWQTWGWALIALALWPLLVLAGNLIARFFALALPPNPVWPDLPLPLILTESFAWSFLFGGPLNEEPGWRGFALPHLQRRFSPLVASIIVGAFWGLWHVPLPLMGIYYGGALGAVIRIQEIPRAILFTWMYNRTKGSLLVMILFHAAINTTSLFLSRSFPLVFVLCSLLAAAVVVTDKMWRKLPAGSHSLSTSHN